MIMLGEAVVSRIVFRVQIFHAKRANCRHPGNYSPNFAKW
jgi:hypothetical protein